MRKAPGVFRPLRQKRRTFAAMMSAMDDAVGRVPLGCVHAEQHTLDGVVGMLRRWKRAT